MRNPDQHLTNLSIAVATILVNTNEQAKLSSPVSFRYYMIREPVVAPFCLSQSYKESGHERKFIIMINAASTYRKEMIPRPEKKGMK